MILNVVYYDHLLTSFPKMFAKQEEPVYSEAKIEDFTNILPFELELNLNDFTHFILSNSTTPADNTFNITRKQQIIEIFTIILC